MNRGAVILCGGRSSRMGRDKAALPFGAHETMLQRVVRLVSETVPADRIACAAAPRQELPPLCGSVRIVRDAEAHPGPLSGLAAGLAAIQGVADAAFVTGCDAPLLVPALISRMFELMGPQEIAAPHDGKRWHPLAAVYRVGVLSKIPSLLADGERSLVALVEACDTRRVVMDELRDVDPDALSLATCNTADEYQWALQWARLSGSW